MATQEERSSRPQMVVLHALRALGYANLAALIYGLLGMKSVPLAVWPLISPVLCIAGALFYYMAWHRAFPAVSKIDGRRFMRPYLLGLYLLIATVAFFAVLHGIGASRN